jgi:hypothetical protein
VGDPAESDNGDDDSKHPQIAPTRFYRGYSPLTDNQGNQQVDGNGNKLYVTNGMSAGQYFELHDFLVTTINGTVTDSACAAQLQLGGTSEFGNNAGKYVCMSPTCPSAWPVDVSNPVASASTLIVSGAVSGGSLAAIYTSDGDTCAIADGGASYTCGVSDLGAGWTGYIEAIAGTGDIVTSQNPVTFQNLVSDSSGNDFTLSSASSLSFTTISGSLDYPNSVSSVSLALDDGGTCSVSASSYSCVTSSYASTGSWSGTLTVSHNKTLCDDGETSPSAGVKTSNFTIEFLNVQTTSLTKNIVLANQARQCP